MNRQKPTYAQLRQRILKAEKVASKYKEAEAALRELLMNVAKHAGVKSAEVRIRPAGRKRIAVEVRDKGRRITRNAERSERFGLFSIRERAEAMGMGFDINSCAGRGTCAVLTLPIL